MKKKKSSSVIKEMIKRYKWNLLFQILVFAVLMVIMLTWEPVVLKEVFRVIELQETNRLLLCGGMVGAGLIVLFFIGYLNNTYVDMERWRIIYKECEQALRTLPRLSYDEINRHFSEGGIFERIYSLGQARMGVFCNVACIGIYLLTGLFLLANTWSAGLFFVATAIGMLLLELLLLKARSSLLVRYEKKYRNAEENSNTSGSHVIRDLPFILMNHLEEQEIKDFCEVRNEVFGVLCKQKLWEAFFQGMDMCLTVGMKTLLAVWMFPLMLGSGLITAIFATVDKLKMMIGAVAENVVGTKKMLVAVQRFEELEVCVPQSVPDTASPEEMISLSKAGICLENKVIFEKKELKICAGEKVAIIGHNGCGKSSVLKTMLGLYHLTEGELCRKQDCRVAYIPANARLFEGTGEENIKMSGKKNQEMPEKTSDFWFCDGFMEQPIDKMSGGQKQRINIARGLYRDADLVFADEPTSNLDPEASREVMKYLLDHTNTCVVITHDRRLLDLFMRVIELDKSVAED